MYDDLIEGSGSELAALGPRFEFRFACGQKAVTPRRHDDPATTFDGEFGSEFTDWPFAQHFVV